MQAAEIVVDSLQRMGRSFLSHLPQIAIALLVLLATWVAAAICGRVASRAFTRAGLRESLVELFKKLIQVGVWVLGLFLAGSILIPGLSLGSLVAVLGLGSVAIGFAFKDIFENFLAGVLLLLREPFQLEDHVECRDVEGRVEEINIRNTFIRQTDGQLVVLPNAMLFTNPVTVRTNLESRRLSVVCGVGYGEDVDQAREVIRKAVEGLESLNREKPVDVFACSFGASSVDFEIRWWTGSAPRDIKTSLDQGIAAIKGALDEAGIEIPFPYRTHTFAEPVQVVRD